MRQKIAAVEIEQLERLFVLKAGEGRFRALPKTFGQATQLEVAFWKMAMEVVV